MDTGHAVLLIFLVICIFVIAGLITFLIEESKQRKSAEASRTQTQTDAAATQKRLQDELAKYRERDKPNGEREATKARRRQLELDLVATKQKAMHLDEQITELRVSETDPLIAPDVEEPRAAA